MTRYFGFSWKAGEISTTDSVHVYFVDRNNVDANEGDNKLQEHLSTDFDGTAGSPCSYCFESYVVLLPLKVAWHQNKWEAVDAIKSMVDKTEEDDSFFRIVGGGIEIAFAERCCTNRDCGKIEYEIYRWNGSNWVI